MSTIKKLIKDELVRLGWSTYDLAEAAGLSQATVSNAVNEDHPDPSGKTIKKIAKGLGISEVKLLNFERNEVLEMVPLYIAGNPQISRIVPLLNWMDIDLWVSNPERFNINSALAWLPCIDHCSEKTFALIVQSDAMMSPYPGRSYPEGSKIFVDPQKMPKNNCGVIVSIPGWDAPTFKEYSAESGRVYLKSLNPQYPTYETDASAVVFGVVIAQYISES